MRSTLLTIAFSLYTVAAFAEPSASQLALGQKLAELLQVKEQYDDVLKQCQELNDTNYDPKFVFSLSPESFGGITPQSAYWAEVQVIYRKLQIEACNAISAEKYFSYYANQYAINSSEEDLLAAIAFFSSPAGKRIQAIEVVINESFQKNLNDTYLSTYRVLNSKLQIDIHKLIKKYKDEPR